MNPLTGERYEELVQQELDRLDGFGLSSPKRNRDATIRAVALATIDGRSIRSTLDVPASERGKNVVSQRVYYDKEKDYYNHPAFRAVLERVIAIYQKRELSIKEAADEAARRKRHEENANFIRAGKTVLQQAYAEILKEIQRAKEQEAKGEQADIAVGMTPIQLAQFQKLVLEEERRVYDEELAAKVEVEIDWRSDLPEGVTASYAEAQLDALAQALVEQQLAQIERGELDFDELVKSYEDD